MRMSLSGIKIVLTVVVGCSILGCNVGTSPAGGSTEDVKEAFNKMPQEEQLKVVRAANMPADKKREKIAELYKKAGKTPHEDLASEGMPSSGPPPGVGMPSQGGR